MTIATKTALARLRVQPFILAELITLIVRPPGVRRATFGRRVLTLAIVAVLLTFFSVPIAFILYGACSALNGLIVIGVLIVVQLPVFMIVKWLGALPPVPPRRSVKFTVLARPAEEIGLMVIDVRLTLSDVQGVLLQRLDHVRYSQRL